MIKLSVIIPCYKDNPTKAINSIKNQLYYDPRDVEIILCMDDPDRNLQYDDVLTIATDINSGPGLTRQRGIDAATGEYFTFLDCDDIWYNSLGYMLFLRDMYWRGSEIIDILKFGILEQMTNDGFNLKSGDSTWCFGKIFRTDFIRQNNIRFHPELRVHEDSYFVRLTELYNPIVHIHQDAVYFWINNPRSIVRRNGGEYWQNSFSEYIRMTALLIEERNQLCIEYDGMYDIAYMYEVISRMDDKYINECIAAIKNVNHDYTVYANRTTAIYGCIEQINKNNSFNPIIPKFSFDEFISRLRA